ncbi:ImuA family protein [Cohaesibacter celericrescens]|uniref:Protein ImuA n=1 Tax=Cohaesibacter celericrescens TaxID=2067669 RepID=A0A2N5XMS0_9HYPH|nr:hypothetical protein [Cohaesibacter celericrescens]PLW75740.1 hypothetical protein C0081_18505 [Cohaesibacter celericrescens]
MDDVFANSYPLKAGRAHEVTGHGSTAFAAIACGIGSKSGSRINHARPALWLTQGWRSDQLNPVGLSVFCDPHRMLLARVADQKNMLACAEEALRSGAVSTVVVEVGQALSFTAGRRLQLAAEMGGATGLLLIGEDMGNNAAESRWHCAPLFRQAVPGLASSDSTLQRWQIIKNKSGTIGYWDIIWDAETRRVIVVSEAGERPHYAATASDDAVCPYVAAE